jgi:hypothetical protein
MTAPGRPARRRPVHPKLAQARAYWRLAARAEKAGQLKAATHYRQIGDRRYATYQADLNHLDCWREQRQTARAI